MTPGDLAFYAAGASPIGGLLVAIPFAILELHYSAWRAVVLAVPLGYVQVVVVDVAWLVISRWEPFRRFIARRRSRWVERLLAARGGFWVTFFATPFVGPWLVMAFMRYAGLSQRRVILPILASLTVVAILVATASVMVPTWFAARLK